MEAVVRWHAVEILIMVAYMLDEKPFQDT